MQKAIQRLLILLALACSLTAHAETPTVEWIRQIGTSNPDISFSVAVDAAGNAYISGGTDDRTPSGSFLTRIDSRGNVLWTEQVGTSSSDRSWSVAVDVAGYVYVSGSTTGSLEGTNAGGRDAFLTKFDSSGGELWTKQIGTSEDDYSSSVAVDAAGNAYISGYTNGSLGGTNTGGRDAFLTKFDSSGGELWTKQVGTSEDDYSSSVALDAAGNAYISGITRGSLAGPQAGYGDAFVAKFDSGGNELWTEQIGTSSNDSSNSVAIDAAGNAYISGETWGSLGGTHAGLTDAFLTKFDSSGNELWTEQIGTSRADSSTSVAADAAGNIYISGSTRGSLEGTTIGSIDAFLTKFDSSGNELWTDQIGTSGADYSTSIAVDAAGNVYSSGATSGSLGGPNAGNADAFLIKYRIVPEPTAAVMAVVAGVAGLVVRRRG